MKLPSVSRREFILLTLQFLALSQITGCSSRTVLGKDPVRRPLMAEDHCEALAHWAQKGYRDAILINIDTHDDMRWIPEPKVEALHDIYRHKDWQKFRSVAGQGKESLYHIGNWIYAGGRLGMFREIWWVIPFDVLSMNDPDAKMRSFLKEYQFSDEEIGTFSLHDRHFRGNFHGVPMTVCDIRSLPRTDSPLLLSIDTDFFPPYSTVHEKSYLASLHEVFQALHARQYRVIDAMVSWSVNDDFLPPYLRWVGDAIGNILEKPGLIDESPAELLTLLQQVENDYRGRDGAAVVGAADRWQTKYPNASLQAYRALGYLLGNEPENAYRAAVESCRRDLRYATLLPYMATWYYSVGRYDIAERLYRAGFAAAPGMRNGLFQYAHCLRRMGRPAEALQWYEKDEAVNGPFPTRFLIAETQMLLQNREEARASVLQGVEALAANRYAQVVNHETAKAIYATLEFCDREGLPETGAKLRSHAAVAAMFTAYPKKTLR